MGSCIVCGKPLKSGNYFCSNACQKEYEYLVWVEDWKNGKESGLKGKYGISNHLKRYIFEKYDFKCAICSWSKENKFTGSIPLEVEHIDGNYSNNKEENLILLCPNCHSLTATYKGANKGMGRKTRNINIRKEIKISKSYLVKKHPCVICGKLTKNKFSCSVECEHIRRTQKRIEKSSIKLSKPNKEVLIQELKENTMVDIGRKYGVTDNTVRKWCKSYKLPYKKEDIRKFFNVST